MATSVAKTTVTGKSKDTVARKKTSTKKSSASTDTTATKKTTRKKKTTKADTTKEKNTAATTNVPGQLGVGAGGLDGLLDSVRQKITATGGKVTPIRAESSQIERGHQSSFVDIGSLMPGNLYEASSRLPYVDPGQFDTQMEQVSGQLRAVQLLRENLKVINQLTLAEGQQITIRTNQQKNQTLGVRFEQEAVGTQIAQKGLEGKHIELEIAEVGNQITNQRLQQAIGNLNGETEVTQLRTQSWDLKLQGLRAGITEARDKLSQARSQAERSMSAV